MVGEATAERTSRISWTRRAVELFASIAIVAGVKALSLLTGDVAFLFFMWWGPLAAFIFGYAAGVRRRIDLAIMGIIAVALGLSVVDFCFDPSEWPLSAPAGSGMEWLFLVFLAISVGVSMVTTPIGYAIARYMNPQDVWPPRAQLVCSNCGYPLVGLTKAVCPECGAAFDETLLALNKPPRPPSTGGNSIQG